MSDSLPLIWTGREAPPAALAVYHTKGQASVKIAFLLLHVRTKQFLLLGVDAWSHEVYEQLVPTFCVSDGEGKGLLSNHMLDFLKTDPARVSSSSSAEHQAVSRTYLD